MKLSLKGEVKDKSVEEYNYRSISSIQISTHWLRLAGIETGDEVSVSVEEGKLVISKKEQV